MSDFKFTGDMTKLSELSLKDDTRIVEFKILDIYKQGYESGRASKEPVFFPPCDDCNKKMDEVRRAYDKVQAGKNIVEELEKIKAKIFLYNNPLYEKEYIEKIIDNRIKELKGEQE